MKCQEFSFRIISTGTQQKIIVWRFSVCTFPEETYAWNSRWSFSTEHYRIRFKFSNYFDILTAYYYHVKKRRGIKLRYKRHERIIFYMKYETHPSPNCFLFFSFETKRSKINRLKIPSLCILLHLEICLAFVAWNNERHTGAAWRKCWNCTNNICCESRCKFSLSLFSVGKHKTV